MSLDKITNWHWVERDCTKWAQIYLNEHLVTDINDAKISEVSGVEGDAAVAQRKGRVMAIFDLTLDIKVMVGECVYDGRIDLCSESCGENPSVRLNPSNKNLAEQISKFMVKISERFSKDLIESNKNLLGSGHQAAESNYNHKSTDTVSNFQSAAKKVFETKSKTFSVEMPVECQHLRQILIDPNFVLGWSSGTYRESSGCCTLFDGLISYSLTKNEAYCLEYTWKLKEWPESCKAIFQLDPFEGDTNLSVRLSNIPLEFADDAEGFFDRYYWSPIKRMLGIF